MLAQIGPFLTNFRLNLTEDLPISPKWPIWWEHMLIIFSSEKFSKVKYNWHTLPPNWPFCHFDSFQESKMTNLDQKLEYERIPGQFFNWPGILSYSNFRPKFGHFGSKMVILQFRTFVRKLPFFFGIYRPGSCSLSTSQTKFIFRPNSPKANLAFICKIAKQFLQVKTCWFI